MKILEQSDIKEASDLLKKGGVVAFPTDTVYGLGVISNSEVSFEKLVNIKRRSPNKPFTLMCSNINQVSKFLEITPFVKKVIAKFMPGPLTLVLKTKVKVPYYFDLGTGYVGFRIPDTDYLLKMIDMVGCPLFVPSANISNFPPAYTIEEVKNYFDKSIEAAILGLCDKNKIPSTVCKIENDEVTILRNGPITKEEILELKFSI